MSLWTWFGLTNGNVSTEWPLKGDAHGQQGVLGMPRYDPARCQDACDACARHASLMRSPLLPAAARRFAAEVDWGRCIVCQRCTEVCPTGAFSPSAEWAVGVTVGTIWCGLRRLLRALPRGVVGTGRARAHFVAVCISAMSTRDRAMVANRNFRR